jgi:hypothetical protein
MAGAGWERRLGRLLAGALVAVSAGLLVPTSALAATKQENLHAMLLRIGQMPTGWSVNSSGGNGIGCLHQLLEPKGLKQTATAGVSLADSGGLPAVGEKLATYGVPATKAFAKITQALDHCTSVEGTSNGTKVTGTVGQMSFPTYGNQSEAYSVDLTVEGATADEDVLVVRNGAIVMGIDEGDLGTPDLGQFEGFVSQALADLSGSGAHSGSGKKGSTGSSGSGLPTAATIPPSLAGDAHPSLTTGKPGSVDVVYTGAPYGEGGTTLPVVVWNGTSAPVDDVDVSGSATVGGKIVGSGDSQGIEPQNLQPGQLGFGFVYFETSIPAGATFNLTATSTPGTSTYYLDAPVTQANYIPGGDNGIDAVTGSVSNPGPQTMSGPITANVYCFTGGNLTAVETGFTSSNAAIAPGTSTSYSTDVTDPCPTFLVGASGFGQS